MVDEADKIMFFNANFMAFAVFVFLAVIILAIQKDLICDIVKGKISPLNDAMNAEAEGGSYFGGVHSQFSSGKSKFPCLQIEVPIKMCQYHKSDSGCSLLGVDRIQSASSTHSSPKSGPAEDVEAGAAAADVGEDEVDPGEAQSTPQEIAVET